MHRAMAESIAVCLLCGLDVVSFMIECPFSLRRGGVPCLVFAVMSEKTVAHEFAQGLRICGIRRWILNAASVARLVCN